MKALGERDTDLKRCNIDAAIDFAKLVIDIPCTQVSRHERVFVIVRRRDRAHRFFLCRRFSDIITEKNEALFSGVNKSSHGSKTKRHDR